MRIFNGKKIADETLSDLKKKIKKRGFKPKLAVISVGKDLSSELFIRNKKRAAQKIGINILYYKFKEPIRQAQGKKIEKEIIERIERLNSDSSVNGIIVQLPLPKNLNTSKIIGRISSQKDVDGFQKKTPFLSPLISAIRIALKSSTKTLKGKKIVALVRSDFFGRALKFSLAKEKIKIDYLKNKKNPKIKKGEEHKFSSSALRYTRAADIIISICGCPNLIKGDMIKKGAVLIDVGITILKDKKIVGDVDRKSVEKKAGFLTPVPGGLGSITVALLLKNVYYATKFS